MALNHPRDDSTIALALVACVIAAIAIIAMTFFVLGAAAADNDVREECLTREQARARYPGRWLYWRTSRRCWYAQEGRKASNPNHPSRPARPTIKTVRWNEYNELDAAADRDTFFDGAPIPIWRLAPIPHPRFVPWEQRIGL
jgi:hypothetical protein